MTTTTTNIPENGSATAEHQNDTLPVPNPTVSYWRAKPHHLDSHRTTPDLPTSCDVLIIGSGMAGVSVAYHLATSSASQPAPPSTLLLDARRLCSGATGRNGGHIKVKTATLLAWTARRGAASASALDAFARAHMAALAELLLPNAEDGGPPPEPGLAEQCEFELRRSWDVFVDEEDAARVESEWQKCLERGDAWTEGREFVRSSEGGNEAEEASGVKGVRAAVSSPACSLWPYRFVAGLLERAMERNTWLNVQTETPVVAVERGEGDEWVVRTENRGEVRARKVVFATNAYTAGLLPRYRGVITPYKGTCAHLTAGVQPVQPRLSHTYNIDHGWRQEGTVDYLNPRPDGGVVVGGGNWLFKEQRELWYDTVDDSTLFEPVMKAKYFEGYMQRIFHGWEDSGSEADRVWTGIMGVTPDQAPHIGKVPGEQNQWILAGFNGGGMPLIFLSAKGVAKMALEDVPFEETGVYVPSMFKTTEGRLAKHS